MSVEVLVIWLERGDCNKRTSGQFYSMVQVRTISAFCFKCQVFALYSRSRCVKGRSTRKRGDSFICDIFHYRVLMRTSGD